MPDFGLKVAIADTVKDLLGDTLEHRKSTSAAITPDGDVEPTAVKNAIPWQHATWYIEEPSAGTNVGAEYPLPQGAVIRQVSIRAKTPPSGGQCQVAINKGAGTPLTISLQPGMASEITPMNEQCAPGSVLTLNVLSVSGVTGVTVTAHYGGLI